MLIEPLAATSVNVTDVDGCIQKIVWALRLGLAVVTETGDEIVVPDAFVSVAAVAAETVNSSVTLTRAGNDFASVILARLVLVIVQDAPKLAGVSAAVIVRVLLVTVAGLPLPGTGKQVMVTPGSQKGANVSAMVRVFVPPAGSRFTANRFVWPATRVSVVGDGVPVV